LWSGGYFGAFDRYRYDGGKNMLGRLFRWIFGRGKAGDEAGERLTSLVWLLKEPRKLTQDTVLILARKALGEELVDVQELPPNPEAPGNMFLVIVKPMHGFGVISAHRPYVDDPAEQAEKINEQRRAAAFASHRAWISVDMMGEGKTAAAYGVIGRLMAELAGPDCLALYSTQHELMMPWNENLPERLRGPKPLDAVMENEQVPVVNRPDDDPEILAAAKEAHRRWPEFVTAFGSGDKACEGFSVKAPFKTKSDEIEWMWIEVQSIDGDTIRGALANDPVNVPDLQCGSPVEVEKDRIQDWLYLRKDKMVGGFTVNVIMGDQG
jgi:uncharacterized protein YegJ (DUF2314 family)